MAKVTNQASHNEPGDEDHHDHKNGDSLLAAPTKPALKKPRMFKVLLLNDDYTTMDFVIMILEDVFYKSREEAVRIMMHVHQKGKGVCGIYSRDIAESKVQQVIEIAKDYDHPLQCTLEPE